MTELTQQNSKRDRLKHLLLLRLNWRQITRLIRKFCNEQRTCLKPKSNNDSIVKRINFELKKNFLFGVNLNIVECKYIV